MRGYELGRIRTPALAELANIPTSPERGMPCPQTWFDPILQDNARSYPHVTLRHRVRLESFVQDPGGVTATLKDENSGATEIVRTQYLIGCDGISSTVRDLLGIQIRGALHIDWAMTVYLRIPDLHAQHDKGRAFRYIFVGPEGTWSFLSIVDGKDLWRLQLVDLDEERLHRADIAALMRRGMGGDVAYTIEHKDLWTRKCTVADRFMDGRVFLAGDSAHAHPPNGGLGMNTGIQDAFDLGWKIAAMLEGWGGDGLLESYDTERRPASARAAEVSLKNYRRLISAKQRAEIYSPTPEGDAARRAIGAQMVEENEKSWHPVGIHLGYHLSSIVDRRARWDRHARGRYRRLCANDLPRRARAACLARARQVDPRSVRQRFCAVEFFRRPVDDIVRAAAERGVPLVVHRLDHPEAAALYERALVLVRPDGHVAWRGDSEPTDAFAMIDTVRGAGPRIAARRAGDIA